MARYYRRRYTRVIKPKKKWASNIARFEMPAPEGNRPGYGAALKICENSTQVAQPTPVIVKVGNIKTQLDVTFATTDSTLVTSYAYVLYVPEGTGPVYDDPMNPTAIETYEWGTAFVARHPEWIMGCRLIGSNYGAAERQNYDRVQFSSRLKRNLNSGDKIILFISAGSFIPGEVTAWSIASAQGHALVQFWTCAN